MAERDLDVVVFGATGVTGRQVAAYLAQRTAGNGASWAAVARDTVKCDRVLGDVGVAAPETICADLTDSSSLAEMASRAKVVLNLAGPYTLYGLPVIEACVANGAHYVDLTGEIPFVREMIDAFDARAADAGVKVVQVCGFEALPPDLGVALAAEAAHDRFGDGLAEADVEVSISGGPSGLPRPSDMLSGGTLQSLAAAAGNDNAATIADPAALVTDPARAEEVRRRSPITIAPRRGSSGNVLGPMAPAAFINPAVIQRTAALSGEKPFRYREGVALGGGAAAPLWYALAGVLSGTQAAVLAAAKARPSVRNRVSSTLTNILPSSGFGPTEGDRMEAWNWAMAIDGRTAGGQAVRVEIDGDGHPGYLATARMLGEVGLLLAEAGATPERAGCLTPATALGTGAAARFDNARVRFSVHA